jgi:deoxyribonuclease-4
MSRGLAPIGAHISVAGGLARALPRISAVAAEAAQLFVANPRGWANPPEDAAADAAFGAACGVPVFVHAPYLINLGSPSHRTLEQSDAALRFSLRRAAAIGARAVVVHAGWAVLRERREEAVAQARECVLRALDALPDAPGLLIEPTAGGAGALAADAASTAAFLAQFGGDERIGLCLDTCHMHSSGHDLSTVRAFAATLRAYAQAGRIGLVHVNDSRDLPGSKRDRHESIGRGSIGADPFAALFSTAAVRNVPLVVETAEADHAADIATLKALRAAARTRRVQIVSP